MAIVDNREIDKLVAEKVMGLFVFYDGPELIYVHEDPSLTLNQRQTRDEVPYYSSSIAAAWEVAEKFAVKFAFGIHCPIGRHRDTRFIAVFHKWKRLTNLEAGSDRYEASANTAALAICLAALKANGVEL